MGEEIKKWNTTDIGSWIFSKITASFVVVDNITLFVGKAPTCTYIYYGYYTNWKIKNIIILLGFFFSKKSKHYWMSV